jgi:hypothetical protein
MEFRDEEKMKRSLRRSKIVLGTIVVLIIIAEVLRWFFDKG